MMNPVSPETIPARWEQWSRVTLMPGVRVTGWCFLQTYSLVRVVLNIALFSLPLLHQLRAGVTCESLSTMRLLNTTITTSQPITNGSFAQVTDLPPFCRIAGEIRPTTDSQIRFELWLPLKDWNHKFVGVGNVGFAGSVMYPQLSGQLRRGYATGSTDTGHSTLRDGPGIDAVSFALGHPERVTDFAYRAVHEMTVASKALAASFYGTPVEHSYWMASPPVEDKG